MKALSRILLVLVLLLVVAVWQRAPLVNLLLPTIMVKAMNRDTAAQFKDGLTAVLCGAGGPLYDPKRSAPCTLVLAGETQILIDAGSGSARQMARFGFNVGKTDLVLLTHFHSDHIDGLGEVATIRWAQMANRKPLPVIGPEGVVEVVAGFNVAYEQDQQYRHAHHGDAVTPTSGAGMTATAFTAPPEGVARDIYQKGDLRIEMFLVDHHPVHPAVGYRVFYKGRSLVITGDTRRSGNVLAMAKNVDVLIHEALSPTLVSDMHAAALAVGNEVTAKITTDIPDYHTSPVDAAKIASEAGVGHLLFNHVVPGLPLPGMDELFVEGVANVFSQFTLGQDGSVVSLPADSKEILIKQL